MTFMERLGVLLGMLLGCYALVWCGWHLAIWAARTGRISLEKIDQTLKGLGND